MQFMTKKIIIILLILATGSVVFGQGGVSISKNGIEFPVTTTVPFLRIIPDARSGGMGDVGVAVADDASAIFHNPANLAFVKNL